MRLCAPSLICLLLPLFTGKADGYYGQGYMQCYYTRDLVSIEFIYSWYFNMVEYLRYNSTTDRFTGFTAYGERMASSMNLDPKKSLYFYVYTFCKDYCDQYSSNVQKQVKPQVTVRSLVGSEPQSLSAMLLCSAYDYHPKGIKVLWLRDGKVVTDGVSSTEELSDGDWYYQTHSYLQYTPRPEENISCVVQHESLTQPLITTWERHLPEDQRNKLIIGIFLMVLGIVLAVVGFLYYMLRSKACAKQTSQTISLGSTVSETNSEAALESSEVSNTYVYIE
ncbi:rano class II histocompatibility antigen, A beta chain-like isoform X3 [Tachysurus fulvidraco]|uniref:rano class II histocompatibility antigen, A beta chain-like isoform X3 n=1 Tax=Tachysurus fulvidraco TaxID=1234273 RepID=UPI001FEEE7BD|nr:rano class II histocompatibility antigen, A beta chain-like isoform X3 [Tachysurus fulvidraco]XP_047656366.1 rano class II histocompatibility antigen, A beta chain-like isoform X3 [Tachysurus fulvidraco]